LAQLPEATISLRERKKLKTRAAIQREAMRLFSEKGFQATTIEEIAGAVEISPSTFFNYFPSKDALVLEDDLDPVIIAAFNAQPPGMHPVAALRIAMRKVFAELAPEQELMLRRRTALIAADAELRAVMLDQFTGLVDQVAEILAGRMGRSAKDFRVRNLAGALIGVIMAALLAAGDTPGADLMQLMDEAMAHLEAGLPLD
jgi:AcrR family transcriptional regulator